MSDSNNGLIFTGLLAVLGTVAGGVIQGYWETNLAEADFQSQLVMKALEAEDTDQRIASLEFLVDANLITEPKVREGIKTLIKKGDNAIPQFSSRYSQSVTKDEIIKKFPELEGQKVALIGFKVRSASIIDAITPIYSTVNDQFDLLGEFEGDRIGGDGGRETILKKPGYVVTGFDTENGIYKGEDRTVHFQVHWSKITRKGVDANSMVSSVKFGDRSHVTSSEPPIKYRAKDNHFISNVIATTDTNGDNKMFVKGIKLEETFYVKR